MFDERVGAGCVRDRKQRVVSAPDELQRDLDLVQPVAYVVLRAEQCAWRDEGSHRCQVGVVVALGRVELTQVVEIAVVHRAAEVHAGADVAAGDSPDDRGGHPVERVAGDLHHRLPNPWQGHQPVCQVDRGPAQAERVDQDQLAHALWLGQRQLEGDAPTQ